MRKQATLTFSRSVSVLGFTPFSSKSARDACITSEMIAAYVSPWNRSISRRRRRFEAHLDSAPTMFDPILQYLGTIPAEGQEGDDGRGLYVCVCVRNRGRGPA